MDERLVLMEDGKEKLVDEIIRLRRENQKLRDENEDLKKKGDKKTEIDRTKKREFLKTVAHRSRPPHRWGRQQGHLGSTRTKPTHIDHDVRQSLTACPDCHHPLGDPTETIEHIQEDIVPSRVEVTRFLHHRYWCPGCRKILTAPYAKGEVPHGYLGPRTLATMVWFKYHLALPANKIKDLFYDLSGLQVSNGAITQALQRLAGYLQVEADTILKAIQEAPHKHVDETGWKVNGVGHWLWSFVNSRWAFFQIDKSRGSRVPKHLLGHPFQGTVISDFFSAYNKIQGRKQKCLVHLKREVRNARSPDPPPDFRDPDKKLTRLLADAQRLADRRETLSPLVWARRVRRLKNRLFHFASETYSHKFWQRLSARLLKHHKDLLTFLDIPGLSADNNAAERSIKPHVIIRNRSYQNRTDKGAKAHSVLSSLVQTLLLQNRSVVPALALAYTKHRQGRNCPALFTSES